MADLTKFVEYAKSFYLQRVAVYSLIVLSSFFVIIPMGLLQVSDARACVCVSCGHRSFGVCVCLLHFHVLGLLQNGKHCPTLTSYFIVLLIE
ncbi:hypothetical protein BaRGS_00004621 [Batillaria attramentaria]|uniref:Uncharacterized protein n=1 Tax=Batillaria attramentaria TaxID=370345 RepID=A0ABD0LXU7_9CAEN